ncbi:MAG: hypothetical protein MK291_13660, partial [Planctomycetes bacterium]|nr:hypothetical protein [Planctomycetota bacterium]
MTRITAQICLALFAFCSLSHAQSWTQRPGTESWYSSIPSGGSWNGAQAEAENKGGYLACFETEAEWLWVRDNLEGNGSWRHFGLTFDGTTYRWLTGTELNYGAWETG